MSRREEDIEVFRKNHPDVQLFPLANGCTGMLLPAEHLPPSWSKETTELLWLVQPNYPSDPLDCFWVDADANSPSANATAVNTQIQPCPAGTGKSRRWVSWHMQPWLPAKHNIELWLNSMRQGLRNATGRVP